MQKHHDPGERPRWMLARSRCGLKRAKWCNSVASPRLGDAVMVDGENFGLVAPRRDSIARGSTDQSPRDG